MTSKPGRWVSSWDSGRVHYLVEGDKASLCGHLTNPEIDAEQYRPWNPKDPKTCETCKKLHRIQIAVLGEPRREALISGTAPHPT